MLNPANGADWPPHDIAIDVGRDLPDDIGAHSRRGAALVEQLQTLWLQLLLCLAAALPLLWVQMPPLTDLGGHLGRFAVQIDFGQSHGATAALRQWYSFHWHVIPNLGVDLLMQLLAPQLGLEPALKAIVAGIVLVQTAGFLALAKAVHGRLPPTALLALPLVYGYPFQYGFLNYVLATALGTWALALWVRLDQPELRARRWLAFAAIASALWVCHLAGWALFCTFAAGIELARWRERGLSWRGAGLAAAVPLSCLAVPCVMFVFWPHVAGPPGSTHGWFDGTAKLGMIVMALRDRWGVWDVGSALALIGVIAWSWGSRHFTRHRGLALGAALAGAAFVIVPKHVQGTSFVDMRLVPMILGVALIAVRPRADCPRRMTETVAVLALVFCGARFVGNAASLALFNRQFVQDLAVLDTMPRDTQLVTLSVKPCLDSEPWLRERRTHLAGYALARRHDFANDQWTAAGGQLLQVHNPAAGAFIGDPSQSTHPTACRGQPGLDAVVASVPQAVTYLWIVENGVARSFPGWTPIRFSSGSVLYTRG